MGLSCCRLLKVTISPLPSCPKVPKPRPLWAHPSIQHLAVCRQRVHGATSASRHGGAQQDSAELMCHAAAKLSQEAWKSAILHLGRQDPASGQPLVSAFTHACVVSGPFVLPGVHVPWIKTLASSLKLSHSSSVVSAVASPDALSKMISPLITPSLSYLFCLLLTWFLSSP